MNYNPGSRFTTFKNTKLKLYSTLSKPKSNSSSLQHNTISTTSLNKSSNTSNNNNTFNFNKQTHISNLCLVMPVISTTRTSNSKNNNNNNNHHPQKPSFKRPPQQPLNQTYMSTIPYLNVSKRKGNLKLPFRLCSRNFQNFVFKLFITDSEFEFFIECFSD